MGEVRRFGALLAMACLTAQALGAAPAETTTSTSSGPAREYSPAWRIASLLSNDARDALRNPDLPPEATATEASVLLRFAANLNASSQDLRLLTQTAKVAGMTDVRRDALRKMISLDPRDLVAQVDYIDLLADQSQTLENRAQVYQAALDQDVLDPQIRSEVALRVARLNEERGDTLRARSFLAQALRLNDVNLGALRDFVRLASGDDSAAGQVNQMNALAALLAANPYQSDAWLRAARLCEHANLHGRAAQFLQTSLEQAQLDGAYIGPDSLLELTTELAAGGKTADAFAEANSLAQLPNAPLPALLVAELLAQDKVVGSATSGPATQGTAEKLVPDIRKQLEEMVKAATPADPTPLADAVGIDLTMLPAEGSQAALWLESYGKLVPADDPTLARLRGWMLFRAGKNDDAAAAFEKIPSDPLAQLGRARLMLEEKNKAGAADILQTIYANHPTGLLALQVARTVQGADITLADTQHTRDLRAAAAALTPALGNMHRQPRDAVLLNVSFRKAEVGPGEPVMMTIRMTNVSDRPLPVGPDGVVKTTVGLADTTRGVKRQLFGLYAVEETQRIYRLEPRQSTDAAIRVDQGKVGDLLEGDMGETLTVGIAAVTAPRVLGPAEFSSGAGGQVVQPGDFVRDGLEDVSLSTEKTLAADLMTAAGENRLVRVEAAGALARRAKDGLDAPLKEVVMGLAASNDAYTRAAVAREFPTDALATDADPLVRMMCADGFARAAMRPKDSKDAVAALARHAEGEKDELIKQFMRAAMAVRASENAAATAPATTAP